MRYSLDMIYTYSANILIACNPHKRLRTLYGGKMMRQYKDKQLGELAPHVYAIAEQVGSVRVLLVNLVCFVFERWVSSLLCVLFFSAGYHHFCVCVCFLVLLISLIFFWCDLSAAVGSSQGSLNSNIYLI